MKVEVNSKYKTVYFIPNTPICTPAVPFKLDFSNTQTMNTYQYVISGMIRQSRRLSGNEVGTELKFAIRTASKWFMKIYTKWLIININK